MRTCLEGFDIEENVVAGVFFFSSRRRHTRWTGDWSSDVCSSDLPPDQWIRRALEYWRMRGFPYPRLTADEEHREFRRSEERRVGKECRSRWGAYQCKKRGEMPAGSLWAAGTRRSDDEIKTIVQTV